jgi:hypothetical protein
MSGITAADVARMIDIPPDTLRRWVRSGIVPLERGRWSPSAVAQARIVARLRERGHTMPQIRAAVESGRLAYGYLEQLFPDGAGPHSLREAAERTGLEPALIERISSSLGFPSGSREGFTDADLDLLEYGAAVLQAGFPLVAFLQLTRVYGQALTQIADAEVKLFHLYVHEPLMRDGVPGLKMAEEMEDLASDLLPLAAPMMDGLHRRLLRHFVEQDVVGHMEAEGDFDLGRLRVAIAFADLAGYTRLTEQAGEEEAVDVVERFVAGVEATRARDQDDRRRGDDRRLGRRRAGGVGGRLPADGGDRASAAADRDPRGRRALPRRRLLRPRGQPGVARRRARRRRRGAGHAPGRRGGGHAPELRPDRRGHDEGLLRADRAVRRGPAEGAGVIGGAGHERSESR